MVLQAPRPKPKTSPCAKDIGHAMHPSDQDSDGISATIHGRTPSLKKTLPSIKGSHEEVVCELKVGVLVGLGSSEWSCIFFFRLAANVGDTKGKVVKWDDAQSLQCARTPFMWASRARHPQRFCVHPSSQAHSVHTTLATKIIERLYTQTNRQSNITLILYEKLLFEAKGCLWMWSSVCKQLEQVARAPFSYVRIASFTRHRRANLTINVF